MICRNPVACAHPTRLHRVLFIDLEGPTTYSHITLRTYLRQRRRYRRSRLLKWYKSGGLVWLVLWGLVFTAATLVLRTLT